MEDYMTVNSPRIDVVEAAGQIAETMITKKYPKQDDLTEALGREKARQACVPTDFYILGQRYGYIPESARLLDFVSDLDWNNSFSKAGGWFRAKLTGELREKYDFSVVSWKLHQDEAPNFEAMRAGGYIQTQKEEEFYRENILGRDVFEIAEKYPVVVTVVPGFAGNQDTHAIILDGKEGDQFTIIDPNAENNRNRYTKEELSKYISLAGAGSIVLPKN